MNKKTEKALRYSRVVSLVLILVLLINVVTGVGARINARADGAGTEGNVFPSALLQTVTNDAFLNTVPTPDVLEGLKLTLNIRDENAGIVPCSAEFKDGNYRIVDAGLYGTEGDYLAVYAVEVPMTAAVVTDDCFSIYIYSNGLYYTANVLYRNDLAVSDTYIPANADDEIKTDGDWVYLSTGDGAYLISYLGDTSGTDVLNIPASFSDAEPLVGIGSRSLVDLSETVKTIVVPEGVEKIFPSAMISSDSGNAEDMYRHDLTVRLPESLEDISASSFHGCKLEFASDSDYWCDENAEGAWYKTLADGTYELVSFPLDLEIEEYEVVSNTSVIGDYAFAYNTNVRAVTLPEGLKVIENDAFNASILDSVELPDTLVEIGDYAFSDVAVETITIPDSVESIGRYALNLSSLYFSRPNITFNSDTSNLKYLGDYALPGGYVTSAADIPDGLSDLGYHISNGIPANTTFFNRDINVKESNENFAVIDGAVYHKKFSYDGSDGWVMLRLLHSFEGEELVIVSDSDVSNSDVFVNPDAFGVTDWYDPHGVPENETITTIKLSDNVRAFPYAKYNIASSEGITTLWNLRSIEVSEDNEYYRIGGENKDDNILYRVLDNGTLELVYCPSDNTVSSCTVEPGTVRICENAMSGMGFEELILPEGLKIIDDFAFIYCGNLTEVIIPDGVEEIGYRAFSDCVSLTDITIPASVTRIGGSIADKNEDDVPVTFKVYPDSAAHKYCVEEGLKYELLAEDPTPSLRFKLLFSGKKDGNYATVVLTPKANDPFTMHVPYSANGADVTLNMVAGETYSLSITKPGHTSYIDNSFVAGTNTVPSTINLYAGNINGDSEINAKDQAEMSKVFGSVSGSDVFLPVADFNEDGRINAKDRADIVANFNKSDTVID